MPQFINILGRTSALFTVLLLAALVGCNSNGKKSPTVQLETDLPETPRNTVCYNQATGINWEALQQKRCNLLSDYRLFTGAPNDISTTLGIHYELNNELFTDHARKYRYFYLPRNNQSIGYQPQEVIDFPVGSVLVKVLALPDISTDNPSEKIIEVRLMVHRENGWIFIPYVWDETIDDARLAVGGSVTTAHFSHNGKLLEFNYESPSQARCELCHQMAQNGKLSFTPIGPKIRYLNREVTIHTNTLNQLDHWQNRKLIQLPSPSRMLAAAPNWRDTQASLEQRAKAYLDINCAYCHSEQGAAALSGLRLEYWRTQIDYSHGVCNSAHGWRGGGYDIWPGQGNKSSLPLRMELSEAIDRMPPIGRVVTDEDAVSLIRLWIDSMPPKECISG